MHCSYGCTAWKCSHALLQAWVCNINVSHVEHISMGGCSHICTTSDGSAQQSNASWHPSHASQHACLLRYLHHAVIMLQVKGAKSPLGKAGSLTATHDANMPSAGSNLQQTAPKASQAAAAFATSPRREPSPAELAAARQASLQQLGGAGRSASAGNADAATLTSQQSQLSAQSVQLMQSTSAISPRLKRDPSPAEVAIAKQTSLGPGVAAAVTEDAQAFVLSPRQKRDPSPAELGLIRHKSDAAAVQLSRYCVLCLGSRTFSEYSQVHLPEAVRHCTLQ